MILMTCTLVCSLESVDNTGMKQIPSEQLLTICLDVFNISKDDCTCDLFKKPDGSPSDLCIIERQEKDNKNKTEVYLNYNSVASKVYASVTIVALIVAIPGNCLVIAVSVASKQKVTDFRKLIAALAVADMIFAVLEFIRVLPVFWTSHWLYTDVPCRLLRGLQHLGSNVAIGIMLIICVERYLAIAHPMTVGENKRSLYVLYSFLALLAIAIAVPIFVFAKTTDLTGRQEYRCEIEGNKTSILIQSWFEVVFFLVIPSIAIMVLYGRIISQLHSSAKKCDTFKDGNMKRQRTQENVKIAHTLILMTVSFILLVTPHHLSMLILHHSVPDEGGNVSTSLYYASAWMVISFPLHVAVNPIIYSAISKKWRVDAARVLCNYRSPRVEPGRNQGLK